MNEASIDCSVCGISELLDVLCGAGRLDAETAAKVRKFISSTSQASVPGSVPEKQAMDNGHQPSKKRKKVWLSSATTMEHGARYVSGRTTDSQSREPGFEYPLCYRFVVWTWDRQQWKYERIVFVIAAWLECFPEKSSWCQNEQVCQGPGEEYTRYIYI